MILASDEQTIKDWIKSEVSRHKNLDHNKWEYSDLLYVASKVDGLEYRVAKLEPHDHTFKCTTCGVKHD